jgi:hypothetical protein
MKVQAKKLVTVDSPLEALKRKKYKNPKYFLLFIIFENCS